MKQKDKNIFIITIFAIIFLLVWTLSSYNKTSKKSLDQKEMISTQVDNTENLEKADESEEPKNIVPTISVVDLNKKIFTDDAIIIVDVRTLEEFNNGHIKNSLHISEFDPTHQDSDIIFVTATGNEDSLIAYYNASPNTIHNLAGGFNAWQKSDRNIIIFNIKQNFENKTKLHFVEPRDLNKLLTDNQNSNFIIIDTRRSGNYEKGHVPGAINIPFTQLEHRYKEIPVAKKIYTYGADEKTSFEAGVLMHDLEFIDNNTINGGFAAWTEYNYPVVQ